MTFKKNIILFLLAVSCIACEKDQSTRPDISSGNHSPSLALKINEASANQIADTLWKKSQQELNNTLTKAIALQQAVEKLLEKPTEKSLQAAQQQWLETIVAYQQLSPLLYLENKKTIRKHNSEKSSSINTTTVDALESINHWRNRIAAWPIQPGVIDSFGAYIHSGVVNDINLSIDAHTLRGQHLLTDDQEITIGLYAIEYLLFGDKDYKGKKNTGYKRFLRISKLPEPIAKAGIALNDLPNNRRRALITLQARLLVNDMQTLISLYQISGALYLAFQELTPLDKLEAFQKSIGLSLQHVDNLFRFYQEEIAADKLAETKDKQSETQNAFIRRFYKNIQLALKHNLITIKSVYGNNKKSESDTKNIAIIHLRNALHSENTQKNIMELTKKLEKESNKKEAKAEEIMMANRRLSKALLL